MINDLCTQILSLGLPGNNLHISVSVGDGGGGLGLSLSGSVGSIGLGFGLLGSIGTTGFIIGLLGTTSPLSRSPGSSLSISLSGCIAERLNVPIADSLI